MVSILNLTRRMQTAAKYVTNLAYADNFGFLFVFFKINLDTTIQKAQYRRRCRVEDDEFRVLFWPVVGPSMSVM